MMAGNKKEECNGKLGRGWGMRGVRLAVFDNVSLGDFQIPIGNWQNTIKNNLISLFFSLISFPKRFGTFSLLHHRF